MSNIDQWNLNQYEKFKQERYLPFYDLLKLIKPKLDSAVDLGCGSGELTRLLHDRLELKQTLGIDASADMLARHAEFKTQGLEFRQVKIEDYTPDKPFDLVFSHATLQWLDNHTELFFKLASWVAPKGQIAIQVPANFDHVSHKLAREIMPGRIPSVLKIEDYSDLLHSLGFNSPKVRLEVYGHEMPSGRSVIEWVKGTLLTDYKKRLSTEDYERFLAEYSTELIKRIGEGPYYYGFKRILMWGQKA